MSLSKKIITITASIIFISMTANSVINILRFKENYTNALLTGSYGLGYSLHSIVTELLNLGLPIDSLYGLNKKCEQIVKQNPHIRYVAIGNPEGKVLYHSDASLIGKVFTDEASKKSISSKEPLSQIYHRFDGNIYYDVTIPIFDSKNTHIGVIRLGFPKKFIDEKVNQAIMEVIINFIITFTAVVVLLGFFMSHFVVRKIQSLLEQTKKIRDFNYENTIKITQKDEIGALGESFNQMSQTIKNQMMELRDSRDNLEKIVDERTDQLRKINIELEEAVNTQKQLTKAAQSASAAKSEFLANMSHEIRTPLNAIIGFVNLMSKTELSAKQRDYIGKIKLASNTLLKTINDILDFSKIEAKKLKIDSTEFYLTDVLNNIANMLGNKAYDKGLELCVFAKRQVPRYLIGDPFRLEQILINLIDNAIKFTEKGAVVVKVELNNEKPFHEDTVTLLFSVTDTGIGIPLEKQKELFEPFTQADGSTTRKFGGTGLGLSICKSLIELMGGKFGLKSELGKGSKFYFTLPFKRQKIDYSIENKMIEIFQGKRIIIIDQSNAVREFLREILESYNFIVNSFQSADEALVSLDSKEIEKPYSVVLIDWQIASKEILTKFREISFNSLAVAIMVPENLLDRIKLQIEPLRVDAFITKPLNESMMIDTLLRLFDESIEIIEKDKIEDLQKEYLYLNGSRILLVEDNLLNQQVALEMLQEADIIVDIANNGAEAIQKLFSMDRLYDLILMDIQMPEMDGFEVTRIIRESKQHKHIPIVALTAHALMEDKERCLSCGMDDYLTKPLDREELFKTLSKWIKPKYEKTNYEKNESREKLRLPERVGKLDIKRTLERIGGNKEALIKILQTFIEESKKIEYQIENALKNNDYLSLTKLLHTLRGMAGNIGAKEIQENSFILEEELKGKNINSEKIYNLLSQLELVNRDIEEIIRINENVKDISKFENSQDKEKIENLKNELYELLEKGSFTAFSKFEELKLTLGANNAEILEIEKHLNMLQMDKAKEILRELDFKE
ncbi:MAG: response regulator [Thermodesulfovibrio sp.]|nr:response regulator [Thermodesulfovibrio sp.]MDW7999012.1 response regulator [Thermodesulfovibrio sp.]